MNVMEDDASVYDLVTELSKHILQTYRSICGNIQNAYEHDIKMVKHLRTKAFEILLKKHDYRDPEEVDPLLEIQKHAFALKFQLGHMRDAITLENLLQEIEQYSYSEIQVLSVLQLLAQLRDFNANPDPIINVFYYGKTNPALPEIMDTTSNVPPFQIYPMECFISSDKFEATLETQRFQITRPIHSSRINERRFLCNVTKSENVLGIESADVSVVSGFMSNHAFDTASSHTLLSLSQNRHFTINMALSPYISQGAVFNGERNENVQIIPWKKALFTSYLCLPFMQEITEENETLPDTWKSFKHSDVDDLDNTLDIWNSGWDEDEFTGAVTSDYQTWECFGEMESDKEPMFATDASVAAVHLTKVRYTNNLPLFSEKVMNSLLISKEVTPKDFINDLKLMLLGVESSSFQYNNVAGFILRKNITVYGVCSESLEETCQDAMKWGNCFTFLSQLVTSRSQSSKPQQEGLIFKAMCTSIKELLLYYQAALLRIFTYEKETDGLLGVLQKVRSVAKLIIKVAKVCEPYKSHENMMREGNGILTRLYDEAIQVTDSKIALVFYSLLKSCCEVYFRFLQKWIFEGICDDVYGEFMIRTRPQYLRNRGHKFWTKSFSVCSDAVPGFLSDLAESILQCGKTVKLLRICDPKNPVCHICVTEQPEVKVCLSVSTLHEQLSRCREYERIGKSALGPVFSLATAISNQKILEKDMSEIIVRTPNDPPLKIHGKQERENVLKTCEANVEEKKQKENELPNKTLRIETCSKQREQREQYHSERNSLVAVQKRNIWNYYENLSNDLDKRCLRSEWRAKRMTYYDKRIDALTVSKLDSQDQLQIIDNAQSGLESNSVTNTAISFKDENKNYAQTTYQAFTADAMIKLYNDNLSRNRSSVINQETIKNDNENHDSVDFERLKGSTAKLILNISPNEDVVNKLSTQSIDRASEIERPTFLNVLKVNETTERETDGKLIVQSLECDMTPNNNEVEVHRIKVTLEPSTEVACFVEDKNFGTPMSCTTTDNFASSVPSPASQYSTLYNTEGCTSPIETSNTVAASNSSYTITTSPTIMKEDATFSDMFGLARALETTSVLSPSTTAPLTVADVEIIDHTSLHAYLEKSIRIPLDIQSRLVNNAIIKYFLKENNLLSHMHSLRSYFFLLNGEFAKSLTDSLYTRLYQISVPIELFNSATLTNLLERALVNSFNNVYTNSELLSLSALDTPPQLHISDPTALDCLSLNYKISWPLNIILDETVMQQYGRIFKFLITSGRVAWVLQEDFNIMKRERKATTSEQYHKLQLYRHSMTQFMNALHNYLTCSILHASWAEFEIDLENSSTVDQIYLSHVNYIKRILSRCMLNSRGEKVRVCLNNIFKVILKFHNRLRSQSWVEKPSGYVHPNFKKLEQMYRAFSELRGYMAHVVFKLATSGYQPHLMHFLNALNINQLYDLTVKTQRSSAPVSEL